MIVSRRLVYAILVAYIGLMLAVAGVFVYVGYAISKNNEKIEAEKVANNQKNCHLYALIIKTGRPGPFRDIITDLYNDPDYQCHGIEPL